MKLNIYPCVESIGDKILRQFDVFFTDDDMLLDLLLSVRNDLLFETDADEEKVRVYNIYKNDSSRTVFRDNRDLRISDFYEFLSSVNTVYYTVYSGNEIREVTTEEIKPLLEADIYDIIRYMLKNNNKNEATRTLYKLIISDNL